MIKLIDILREMKAIPGKLSIPQYIGPLSNSSMKIYQLPFINWGQNEVIEEEFESFIKKNPWFKTILKDIHFINFEPIIEFKPDLISINGEKFVYIDAFEEFGDHIINLYTRKYGDQK